MGDENVPVDLSAELRDTRARLDAAREEAATLRVLLATRTHQHDLAWQDVQRLTGELAAERSRPTPPDVCGDRAEHRLADELAVARERLAAADIVLGAVAASLGWRGLDRRRFRTLIAEAGRTVPDSGPQAARHAVLLDGARRVLGLRV